MKFLPFRWRVESLIESWRLISRGALGCASLLFGGNFDIIGDLLYASMDMSAKSDSDMTRTICRACSLL